ncbi:MAG: hypothetical protein KGD57_01495 [Candidatus Lokiarchaeota archaeon]|nr:hypothetical protein [Candidatus Lokiarchaeota archaeon]
MCPIITSEDELDLSRFEKEFVKALTELTKQQSKVVKSQQKLADNILDMTFSRDSLNRTMRDVLKQMKMLARENKSNVKNEDVKFLEDLIHSNDLYIDANKRYIAAIKDLVIEKEYLIDMRKEFAEALDDVATKRKVLIKMALNVDKVKNKMIDQEKVDIFEQEFKDLQREFDRARDVLLKKIERFFEVKNKVSKLWLKLKEVTADLG